VRLDRGGDRGEIDDVGEQYLRVLEPIRDHALVPLQTHRDGLGQHVQQHPPASFARPPILKTGTWFPARG
jgi:hypothetical protein